MMACKNLKVSDCLAIDSWNWFRILDNDPYLTQGTSSSLAELKERVSGFKSSMDQIGYFGDGVATGVFR